MPIDPNTIDAAQNVTLVPDGKGPALLVYWRGVPMGFIRPFTRMPRRPEKVPPGLWQITCDDYKKHVGKWFAPLIGGGYFDTKEDAARHVVARTLACAGDSPLIQAALREDHEELQRLLQELRSQVVVEAEGGK